MSSKAAYKVHKVFYPQGFVATFKSLVTFVSKEDLCSFVSLCLKIKLRISVSLCLNYQSDAVTASR